jgi:hypothetical protein
MREIVQIAAADVMPDSEDVFGCLSIPVRDEKTAFLLREAVELFRSLAAPTGIFMTIEPSRFEQIYRGQGRNEPSTPLGEVFPKADRLALFAATVGCDVSTRISGMFEHRDFALASILDAVASEAADLAADVVKRTYRERLTEEGDEDPSMRLLRYSPGYCGWHISGQRALFEVLRPEEIGITLRESFLMEPLKSISGVIVGGPAEIHVFEASYPFCADCEDRSCRRRIQGIMAGRNEPPGGKG